jgi:hypothetical protein
MIPGLIISVAIVMLSTAVLPCFSLTVAAEDEPARHPAVTDGLIHYWPNL